MDHHAGPGPSAQFSYSNTNGALTITYYSGPGGDVIIPDAINGLPVVRIGSVVEGSSTLSDAAWSPTTTLTLDSAGFASFIELELSATARFYRLRWPWK